MATCSTSLFSMQWAYLMPKSLQQFRVRSVTSSRKSPILSNQFLSTKTFSTHLSWWEILFAVKTLPSTANNFNRGIEEHSLILSYQRKDHTIVWPTIAHRASWLSIAKHSLIDIVHHKFVSGYLHINLPMIFECSYMKTKPEKYLPRLPSQVEITAAGDSNIVSLRWPVNCVKSSSIVTRTTNPAGNCSAYAIKLCNPLHQRC